MKLSMIGAESAANYESQDRTQQTQLNFAESHIAESNFFRREGTSSNPSLGDGTSPVCSSVMILPERQATDMTGGSLTQGSSQYVVQKNKEVRAKSVTSPNIQIYKPSSDKENYQKQSTTMRQTIETVTPAHLTSVEDAMTHWRHSKQSLHQQSTSQFVGLNIQPHNSQTRPPVFSQTPTSNQQRQSGKETTTFGSFERRFDAISGRNENSCGGESQMSKALKKTKKLGEILSAQGLNVAEPNYTRSERQGSEDGPQALIYVGGSNAQGQLGLGDRLTGQSLPALTPLSSFNKVHNAVAKVSCGQRHAAIVTQARQLFTMGSNRQGQLGVGVSVDSSRTLTQCSFPMLVDSLAQSQVVDVACGKDHTLAIVTTTPFKSKTKYSVYSWGSNATGQLGLSTMKVHVAIPNEIKFMKEDAEIGRISAGHSHSLFLDSVQGVTYGAGSNTHGQLGADLGPVNTDGPPVRLNVEQNKRDAQQKIVQIACGHRHSLLLTFSGKVYESGEVPEGFKTESGRSLPEVDLKEGQLNLSVRDKFQAVPGLRSVLKIAAGSHSAAIDCKGYLYVWGVPGQCSFGNFPRPFRISKNKDFTDEILTMQVGDDYGLAKNRAGKVYMWGRQFISSAVDDQSSSSLQKSNYEDLLKPLALYDESAQWELKADQIAAGYDSIFVSVIPRAANIPIIVTQQTTNSSLNSKHQGSSAQITLSQSSKRDEEAATIDRLSGTHNRDQKTITSSPSQQMVEDKLLSALHARSPKPLTVLTPKYSDHHRKSTSGMSSSHNRPQPHMFQSRHEPIITPLEPVPYQSQFAKRLFSGEKIKDSPKRAAEAMLISDLNLTNSNKVMSDEKDSRAMMSCEARTAEFRSIAGKHASLQSSLEIEEKRSYRMTNSTDRPYIHEVSDVSNHLQRHKESSSSLSRIPPYVTHLNEHMTIQQNYPNHHQTITSNNPTISSLAYSPHVSTGHHHHQPQKQKAFQSASPHLLPNTQTTSPSPLTQYIETVRPLQQPQQQHMVIQHNVIQDSEHEQSNQWLHYEGDNRKSQTQQIPEQEKSRAFQMAQMNAEEQFLSATFDTSQQRPPPQNYQQNYVVQPQQRFATYEPTQSQMPHVSTQTEDRSNSTITVPRMNNTDYLQQQDFSSKQRTYSYDGRKSHDSTEIDSTKVHQPTPKSSYKRQASTPQIPTPGRFYQNSNASSHSPIVMRQATVQSQNPQNAPLPPPYHYCDPNQRKSYATLMQQQGKPTKPHNQAAMHVQPNLQYAPPATLNVNEAYGSFASGNKHMITSGDSQTSHPDFSQQPSSQVFYGDRSSVSVTDQHNMSHQYAIKQSIHENYLPTAHSVSYPPLQSPTSPIQTTTSPPMEFVDSKAVQKLSKLRKKYKRLKGQARMLLSENDRLRAMVEHDKLRAAADKERMKSTNSEVQRLRNQARSQSPAIQRHVETEKELFAWRSKALQSENELSRAQHENILQDKRTDMMMKELSVVEQEVEGLRGQLVQKSDLCNHLQQQMMQVQKQEQQRTAHINELSRNLDIRAEQCEDYVKHARVLQQTLEEMQDRQDLQISTLKERDYKIEELIKHGHQQGELIEIREGQTNNLLQYIEQLETNNADLLQRMDTRDYQNAKNFQERAYELLKPVDNRYSEAEDFKQRAFNAFEGHQPVQRTVEADRSRQKYIDREARPRHRSQNTHGSGGGVHHTQSTNLAFSPASQKAVCSVGSGSYSPVFQAPPRTTTSPTLYKPSEIRLLNLRERELAENESMVNSLVQNMPQMIDKQHFKERGAQFDQMSDPFISYQGTHLPPTPNAAMIGNARDMMGRLGNSQERKSHKSSNEYRSLGSGGSGGRFDYPDFSPKMLRQNPGSVGQNERQRYFINQLKAPAPILQAQNWREQVDRSVDEVVSRRKRNLLSVDVEEKRNSFTSKQERRQPQQINNNVVARGRLELTGQQPRREQYVYTKEEPKLVNQLLSMRAKLLPPQKEARMMQRPSCEMSIASTDLLAEQQTTQKNQQFERGKNFLSKQDGPKSMPKLTSEARNDTNSTVPVGFDTIQDIILRGQKLLGDQDNTDYEDMPTRTKNSDASRERATSATVITDQANTDPNVTYSHEQIMYEQDHSGASTKVTRAMMQKGLEKVNQALAHIKRDRLRGEMLGQAHLDATEQEESQYN